MTHLNMHHFNHYRLYQRFFIRCPFSFLPRSSMNGHLAYCYFYWGQILGCRPVLNVTAHTVGTSLASRSGDAATGRSSAGFLPPSAWPLLLLIFPTFPQFLHPLFSAYIFLILFMMDLLFKHICFVSILLLSLFQQNGFYCNTSTF